MSPKAEQAWRVLRALYAKNASSAVLRRAERAFHRRFIAKEAA